MSLVSMLISTVAMSTKTPASKSGVWPPYGPMPKIVAGRSIGVVYLGESRKDVWHLAGRKPDESAVLLDGHRREMWCTSYHAVKSEDGSWIDDWTSTTIIYHKSSVIQIEYTAKDDLHALPTYGGLLASDHHLRKRVYTFNPLHPNTIDPPYKYEYVQFYLDDQRRGIAYGGGFQDYFLLTYHPQSVVVHRPGIAIDVHQPDATVHIETGRDARMFRNEADADKGIEYKLR